MASTAAAFTAISAASGGTMAAVVADPTTRIDSTAAERSPARISDTQVQYGASERMSMPITTGPKSS